MNIHAPKRDILREKLSQLGALGYLLLLGAAALAGPYGLLSWGEESAVLANREHKIASLQDTRDELKASVGRLDPNHADPDQVTELLRRNLNVAHPDEYVLDLTPKP